MIACLIPVFMAVVKTMVQTDLYAYVTADLRVTHAILRYRLQQQVFYSALQYIIQLCCTVYQWSLHIVAVGGLCMLTNKCSKGGAHLATGKLSNWSTT